MVNKTERKSKSKAEYCSRRLLAVIKIKRAAAAARGGEIPKTVNRVREIKIIDREIMPAVIFKGVGSDFFPGIISPSPV